MKRNRIINEASGGKRRKQLMVMICTICYLFVSSLTVEVYANDSITYNECVNLDYDIENSDASEDSGNGTGDVSVDSVPRIGHSDANGTPDSESKTAEQSEEEENYSTEISINQQFYDVVDMLLISKEESVSAEEQPQVIPVSEENFILTEGEADFAGAKAAIRTAMNNWEESVELSDYYVTAIEAWALIDEVAAEMPGFRFLTRGGTVWGYTDYCTKVELNYDLTKEEHQQYEEKLYAVYNEVCDDTMTDVEKAMMLHDWIVYETQYQYEFINSYQLLFEHHGICQAYTQAYCVLLDIAGIKNTTCGSSSMNHVWNNIYIDGNWYQVDCTWDDPTSHANDGVDRLGYVGHNHYLRSDTGLTEMGYHDFSNEDGITCTSTTYDSAWWITVGSRIYTINGEKYYLVDETVDGVRTHSLVKRKGDDVTYLLDVSNKWLVWGETSFYRNCALLGYDGTYLYYTSPTEVFRVKPGDTSPETFYTYTGGNGWIYGMYVSEKSLRLQISKTFDVFGGDSIEILLNGDVAVNNITGETKGTYGIDSALTLSVDSVIAEGKEGTYQWYVISGDKEYIIENAVNPTLEVDWNSIKKMGITHGTIAFKCVVSVGESSDEASVSIDCDLRTLFTVKSSLSGNGAITIEGTTIVNEDYGAFDQTKTENVIALKEGADITYVFTPDTGYQIKSAVLDGKNLGAVTTYTIKSISENHTLEITFEGMDDDDPNKDDPNKDDPNKDDPNNDDPNNDSPNKDAPNKDDSDNNDSGDNQDNKDTDRYHYVVIKQKFDVSKFYEGINVSKYIVTSPDTGKASITKKGMLTGKKAGKLMITPCQKIGRKYVPIEGLEPVYIEIIAPYFIPEKMYATYLGEKIAVWELVTGYEGKQKLNMGHYITKKPVVEYIDGKGPFAVGYGSIKYIAVFTNEQGYETKIIKALKVVKLKLSVKQEITLKTGKKKSISIRNVPKSRDIIWVSSDEDVVKCIPDTKKAYKSKIVALKSGTATVSAIVDGQYYSTTITVP